MYAANESNFLDPISYGTQQVEPQFLVAYILMSGPILYGGGWYTTVKKDLHQRCVLTPLLFDIFFAAFIDVAYARFKVVKDTMDALVHLVVQVV